MANHTYETRSTLNNLIESLKDSEEGFRTSVGYLQTSTHRMQFQSYVNQRARFAAELQREVSLLGGIPETTGSAAGVIHRGWIGLKSMITSNDDHAILVEAERGEEAIVKNYWTAMSRNLPRDIHAVIEGQYRDILAAHNHVRNMRDGVATMGSRISDTY